EAWRPPEPDRGDATVEASSGGTRMVMRMSVPVAFNPTVHLGVLPDGRYVVADSSTYAIDIIGVDGTVQKTLSRPIQPAPVTDQIKQQEKARRLAESEQRAAGGAQFGIALGGMGGRASAMAEDLRRQLADMQRQQI